MHDDGHPAGRPAPVHVHLRNRWQCVVEKIWNCGLLVDPWFQLLSGNGPRGWKSAIENASFLLRARQSSSGEAKLMCAEMYAF